MADKETNPKTAPKRPRRMAREPKAEATPDKGSKASKTAPPPYKPQRQTKAAMVEALLAREGGATLDALCKATGWQPHTCRAFLTGLRKKGREVTRSKNADDVTVYAIAAATEGAGAS